MLKYLKKSLLQRNVVLCQLMKNRIILTAVMKIKWQHLYQDSKKCVVSIAKQTIFQQNMI